MQFADRVNHMLRNAPEEFVTTFMGIEVCELRMIIKEYQSKGVDLDALVRARWELANLKRQLLILADVPKPSVCLVPGLGNITYPSSSWTPTEPS